jgi:hypothetical protein
MGRGNDTDFSPCLAAGLLSDLGHIGTSCQTSAFSCVKQIRTPVWSHWGRETRCV